MNRPSSPIRFPSSSGSTTASASSSRSNRTDVCNMSSRSSLTTKNPPCSSLSAIAGGSEFLSASLPLQAKVTIGAPPPSTRPFTNSASASSSSSQQERVFDAEGQVISSSSASSAQPSTNTANCMNNHGFISSASKHSSRIRGGRRDQATEEEPLSFSPSDTSFSSNFTQPPVDPAGIVCDASDRPLFCMSLHGNEVVVGGADHALYAYDLDTGNPLRRLYTKTSGHIDWVSTVTHLEDGRVLSGGGDGKVCLYPAGRGTVCHDLDGHASAVSKVAAVPQSRLAFSAGYDGKIKLWDTSSRRMLTCMDGLDPVMDFDWGGNELVGATRKGMCQVWDLKRAELIRSIKAHRGHVTCIFHWTDNQDPSSSSSSSSATSTSSSSSIFISGGQDGLVKIWDARGEGCIYRIECHADAHRGTTGAVSCLTRAGGLLATAGADKRVCLLEPRMSFGVMDVLEGHRNFVYSLLYVARGGEEGMGNVLMSGGGDGLMLCHELEGGDGGGGGRLLYGLGANQGAVRAMASKGNKLVVAGDDGKAIIYTYK